MDNIFEKIEHLKAEWAAMQPIPTDFRQKLEKKFRLEFNFNSNHIEGNTLTYQDTELLLIFDETKGAHSMREYEELKAHDVAYQLIQQWAQDPRPISEADIKNLNMILLVRPFWKDAITPDGNPTRRQIQVGEYKKFPNSVQLKTGEIFEYTSPIDTPVAMANLVSWFNQTVETGQLSPVELAARLHYGFVRIHPFDDGNGRVARLLMNYALLLNGLPPIIIKSSDKANYLRALNYADTGDIQSFILYIANQLVWSLEISLKAAKGESIEEEGDLDKELVLLNRALQAKESNLTTKYSLAVIKNTLLDSIAPLLETLEEKTVLLKSSFLETQREIKLTLLNDSNVYSINDSQTSISTALKIWISNHLREGERPLSLLRYDFLLKGFKHATSVDTLDVYLEIHFSEFNYRIEDQYFTYHEKMTHTEISGIVHPKVKELIEKVRILGNVL